MTRALQDLSFSEYLLILLSHVSDRESQEVSMKHNANFLRLNLLDIAVYY